MKTKGGSKKPATGTTRRKATPAAKPGPQSSWGGRFAEETAPLMQRFNASIGVDKRLHREDIEGSIAHARMLAARGVIPEEDGRLIEAGLRKIAGEIEAGTFVFREDLEDIHMNIESRLRQDTGDAGARLHTARSRNDQVALDIRLYFRRAAGRTANLLTGLQLALIEAAAGGLDVILPGYTHMQRGQPVRLAHHWLAYVEMFSRDTGRFLDARARANESPLGSGALAGSTFPIDRQAAARELGFDRVTANSMDAVSDRDFLLEYMAAACIAQTHLSRLAEELVIWSSAEFGFIAIGDAFSTGSSMMPQKKNPDAAELIRGKTGRIHGNLIALLTVLKGLPLTYNKDMQEDKEPFFDTSDQLDLCLEVMTAMLPHVRVRADRCAAALRQGHLTATDLAEWMVARGAPFREAHHVVGRLVGEAERRGLDLSRMPLEEIAREVGGDAGELKAVLDPVLAVDRRDLPGGPARRRVKAALTASRKRALKQRRMI
ncbi:MAG: Argininosuccinate lyase [Myxococcota bacterium]|nr:Argininosuccinate lyase [Myxococcota bacterium]